MFADELNGTSAAAAAAAAAAAGMHRHAVVTTSSNEQHRAAGPPWSSLDLYRRQLSIWQLPADATASHWHTQAPTATVLLILQHRASHFH